MTAPWSGLALAVSVDRALISPEGAALVLRLIAAAERVAHRDGIGLPPQLVQLRHVLAPVAAHGHTDVRRPALVPAWTSDDIDIKEAATMLARSTRHTRRLAETGTLGQTRRKGRVWWLSRAEVAAYLIDRKDPA